MFNVSTFGPRTPPKFPLDVDIAQLTDRMRLDDPDGGAGAEPDDATMYDGTADGGEGVEGGKVGQKEKGKSTISRTTYPPPAPLAVLFDTVEGWEAVAQNYTTGDGPPEIPDITACAMGFDGLGLVGVGSKGTLYIWQLRT